jgi:hypothetical protein
LRSPPFIGNANRSEVITLATLPTVGISILVLLALSSHRARENATRSGTREGAAMFVGPG